MLKIMPKIENVSNSLMTKAPSTSQVVHKTANLCDDMFPILQSLERNAENLSASEYINARAYLSSLEMENLMATLEM